MYMCECADYANGHICKHIHGLCAKLRSLGNQGNNPSNNCDSGKLMYLLIMLLASDIFNYITLVPDEEDPEISGAILSQNRTPENGNK